jgi:PhnB protein
MANVKPIPEGYSSITPYLNLKGAAAALEFYAKAFGGELKFRMDLPDGRVGHAEMRIGDSNIMVSEAKDQPESRAAIWLYVSDCDAVFAKAVAAGATVKLPLADMFWGDRLGLVVDPSGQSWNIVTHKEDVPPEEMERRATAYRASQK